MGKTEFKTSAREMLLPEKPMTSIKKEKGKKEEEMRAAQKLARNAVICVALLLCLTAVRAYGSFEANKGEEVSSSEFVKDEDIGKLKFVGDLSYNEPIEGGEVVSAFSQSNTTAEVGAQRDAQVFAVLTGRAVEIGNNSLRIENCNGTVTDYEGITPCVHAGEEVLSGQVIGKLADEKLSLTTVGQTGYIDTLNKEELASANMSCGDDSAF